MLLLIGFQQNAVSVSYYPGERDNEDHQTNTHNSNSKNDNNIQKLQKSGVYSKTVLLLHHSTCHPSIDLTGPTARQKSHRIVPAQTYLEQSIFLMTQR